jgi:thymidylate synthase (FAD)
MVNSEGVVSMKIIKPSVELIWVTPNPEKVIERCGRVPYKSEGRITETSYIDFIKMLLKRDHTAMLEFSDACFSIVCDRGISHELVRHRIVSFAQESTRYCNYAKHDEIMVVLPPNLDDEEEGIWKSAMLAAESAYLNLIVLKQQSPQIARSVLPNSLKTEVVMKTNFRSWLNFLKLRLPPTAHPQMREVAEMIRAILVQEAPIVFEKYKKDDSLR